MNVDTGKMAWYFQTSAHDTHDWDSAQTPILIDGVIDGKPRKLVSTAARNGYFYTLDRVTGEHIVTSKYGSHTNWGKEMRPTGVISPDPAKEATMPGSLVSPVEGGVTNWPPPAYSPDTGLFYVQEHNGFNMLYLTDPDPRGSMGLGGKSVLQPRIDGRLPDGDRLPHGRGGVASPVPWRWRRRPARHRRPPGVFRRRQRQFRRVRRHRRKAALAFPDRQHLECAANLSRRRTPARTGSRRRRALRVRIALIVQLLVESRRARRIALSGPLRVLARRQRACLVRWCLLQRSGIFHREARLTSQSRSRAS